MPQTQSNFHRLQRWPRVRYNKKKAASISYPESSLSLTSRRETSLRRKEQRCRYTARKIGFALFLIRIKDEVKYNDIFDNTFDVHDAHQKYVKYVTPLHIPLTRIKSEFKCINNFDPTFDMRQIEIKQL